MASGFGAVVNKPYVCIESHGDVNVRSAFQLDSPIVRKLRLGDVVQGKMTCANREGHLRLQLDDGTWTSVHAGCAKQPFLLQAAPANHNFVCVDNEVKVRSGYHLESAVVRSLKSGDVVRGVIACPNASGHLRLLLDDGSWTSIHPGTPTSPFLQGATLIDEPFVCVDSGGVKLRRGFHLDSAVVREIPYGEVVHGSLTCINDQGHLRLRIADGTWTSVHAGVVEEPFLHRATAVRGALFECIDRDGVNVRQTFGLNSKFLRKLRCGQIVRGDLACYNVEGHLRLRLDDGSWTSIHAGDEAHPFLRVGPQAQTQQHQYQQRRSSENGVESTLCQVCMDRPKSVAFNCGHQSCQVCAQSLRTCPYCRCVITSRIRLY